MKTKQIFIVGLMSDLKVWYRPGNRYDAWKGINMEDGSIELTAQTSMIGIVPSIRVSREGSKQTSRPYGMAVDMVTMVEFVETVEDGREQQRCLRLYNTIVDVW